MNDVASISKNHSSGLVTLTWPGAPGTSTFASVSREIVENFVSACNALAEIQALAAEWTDELGDINGDHYHCGSLINDILIEHGVK